MICKIIQFVKILICKNRPLQVLKDGWKTDQILLSNHVLNRCFCAVTPEEWTKIRNATECAGNRQSPVDIKGIVGISDCGKDKPSTVVSWDTDNKQKVDWVVTNTGRMGKQFKIIGNNIKINSLILCKKMVCTIIIDFFKIDFFVFYSN